MINRTQITYDAILNVILFRPTKDYIVIISYGICPANGLMEYNHKNVYNSMSPNIGMHKNH